MVAVEAQAPPPVNALATRRKFAKNLTQLELWLDERSAIGAAAKESEADACLPSGSCCPSTPTSVQGSEAPESVPSAPYSRGRSSPSTRTEATPVAQMICFWHDDGGSAPGNSRKFAQLSTSLSRFDMLHS
jgi:hypothetical protein